MSSPALWWRCPDCGHLNEDDAFSCPSCMTATRTKSTVLFPLIGQPEVQGFFANDDGEVSPDDFPESA